ncbi:MAG: OpgC family protein [Gammaproteobacteria bacterium]
MKSDSSTASNRNLQLDFFRGLALMVIFINHMPGNPWFAYTPSRLGPCDAAETFVFLSGFAAAIAFGRCFRQAGLGLGSVRVLFRCGQIYIAHLALFLAMAVMFLSVSRLNLIDTHWQLDNLNYFFDQTPDALLALATLQYVPNFIDILPMYLVILLWLPMVFALSRIHTNLAMLFSVSMYLAASYFGWELTADPLTNRPWYFNPFCWQLVFFTGFAFSSGWLPIPRPNRGLILLCLAYAIFCYPLENRFGYSRLPWFASLRETWEPLLNKNHEGILRYFHFLAMTYLVFSFTYTRKQWLESRWARQVISMGQQSLPIFMLSTGLSLLGGMLLDATHADFMDSTWVNLAGLSVMLLSARFLNWLDSKPWKAPIAETNLSHNWPQHAALAFSVLFLTLSPALLMQSQQPTVTVATAPVASPDLSISTNDIAPFEMEAMLYLADDQIDMPDPL